MKVLLTIGLALILSAGGPVSAGEAFFDEQLIYDVGDYPVALTCADFNGDGVSDMAVANHYSTFITVLFGIGDGTFGPAWNYEVGEHALSISSADLNGDNHADLIIANAPYIDYSIMLNNGDGTFQEPIVYDLNDTNYFIIADDIDGDNDNDLAISRGMRLDIMLNNGDASFVRSCSLGIGTHVWSFCLADFDNDGDKDLATANKMTGPLSGRVVIWLGSGDGIFQYALQEYRYGIEPVGICSEDFDGDGFNDLAVANEESQDVTILFNNGDGTFAEAIFVSVPGIPTGICCADPDDDGDIDLIVSEGAYTVLGGVTVLVNNGAGDFSVSYRNESEGTPSSIQVSDFDGDLDLDLAVTKKYGDAVGIFFNFPYMCGDANSDRMVNIGDAVLIISYIFREGASPDPLDSGDANCDGLMNVGDAVSLVNYIFRDGAGPCCP
jgi:hypothetical protein